MVILTDDDMAELPAEQQPRRSRSRSSCPADQIDPMLLEKSYYLEPEKTGAKPYALLREALAGRRPDGRGDRRRIRTRMTIAVLRVRDDVIVHADDDVARRDPHARLRGRSTTERRRQAGRGEDGQHAGRDPGRRLRRRASSRTTTPRPSRRWCKAKIEGGEVKAHRRADEVLRRGRRPARRPAALRRAAKTARGEPTGKDAAGDDAAGTTRPTTARRTRRSRRTSRRPAGRLRARPPRRRPRRRRRRLPARARRPARPPGSRPRATTRPARRQRADRCPRDTPCTRWQGGCTTPSPVRRSRPRARRAGSRTARPCWTGW